MGTEVASGRTRRLTAGMREEETVTPLELFFDLVFVLALTQCTALMADEPTWEGLAKGMLVLGVLWWSWVGYSWLLGHVEDPLKLVPAAALLGGAAIYLLAHVDFRYRHVHTINTRRLGLAVLLVAFIPVAVEIPALATAAILAAAHIVLIVEETRSYGEARARVRHTVGHGGSEES